MNQKDRIRELVNVLNEASLAYYQKAEEIMSNLEYDRLYDELVNLEKQTGMVLSNSPTVNVGYEVVSELPKERHERPMLSLDKTKETAELREFAGKRKCLLSWKLDGLTVVLTYRNGELYKAVTRGNGNVGEVVTSNVRMFKNLPVSIPYQGELILRGEAVIKYSDFKKINEEMEDVESKYKNPRNLCSGSVRQLNNEITAKRNVNFFAFALITAESVDFNNSIEAQLSWLEQQGFDVVEYKVVDESDMEEAVAYFEDKIRTYELPSDGLVLMYDDIAYGISLGTTAKFPRNGIAFKWADEQAETRLERIEWSPSRTGLINPIAVFNPVELEGTTVSRASLHNVSVMEALELGIGDKIKVYKANMIIPQVAENLTKSKTAKIPDDCPACGGHTEIRELNGVKTLHCMNMKCPAKHVKLFSHFVSRDAVNIEGLSEETLTKFVKAGYIREFADIYRLSRFEDSIIKEAGFGRKSYDKLIAAIDKARTVRLPNLIYSLGIQNVGLSNARLICEFFSYDLDAMKKADREKLQEIDGIGEVIADSFVSYFEEKENCQYLEHLLEELTIVREETHLEQNLKGVTFVITGSLEHFENRSQLKEYITKRGGKVTGTVSSKTDYLINNDAMSSSSKNKKAQELGVKIITEEEFLQRIK